jgi:DNA polymerase-4
MGPAFVEALPVRKFYGVGPATARKMEQVGIKTGLDLKAQTLDFLERHFGKAGSYYYWAARGIDHRPVRADRIRKSIGAENTFAVDLFSYETARDQLRDIIDKVWSYCERSGTRGRTLTLKVKFANFRQITRSRTRPGIYRSPWRTRTAEQCAARTPVSRRQRYPASRYLTVLARGSGGRTSAGEVGTSCRLS